MEDEGRQNITMTPSDRREDQDTDEVHCCYRSETHFIARSRVVPEAGKKSSLGASFTV